uniref:Acyltransferase-like protein At1g54570ic isoform X1 n=1 Tax=Rhizophora mucronata TaxID=61149 RepID=A0A2P2K8T9_RHIMU
MVKRHPQPKQRHPFTTRFSSRHQAARKKHKTLSYNQLRKTRKTKLRMSSNSL